MSPPEAVPRALDNNGTHARRRYHGRTPW